MGFLFKKLIFTVVFNFSLFLILIIGIQNSTNKNKIYLYRSETIEMPLAFIVGVSFITGSLTGNLLSTFFFNKKTQKY